MLTGFAQEEDNISFETTMEGKTVTTQTSRKVIRKDDTITVKTTETITTTKPGEDPEVKVNEKEEVYDGKDAFDRLPEDVRKALEDTKKKEIDADKINMRAAGSNFEEKLLKETNKVRNFHKAPELKLNEELSKFAKERAEEMAEKDSLIDPTGKKFGENVSCLWSNDPELKVKARDIIKRWHDENQDYNYDEEPTSLKAGHFTQMVWESSKELGAAAAKSKSNKIYVVVAYSPPGNYTNEFRNNVKAPTANVESFLELTGLRQRRSSSSGSDSYSSDGGQLTSRSLQKFNEKGVRVSNKYRKRHGVSPLKYNPRIARYAQEWANKLASAGTLTHRGTHTYGENLYMISGGRMPQASTALKAWYSEVKNHPFGREPRSLATGHFTQMVWRTSREIGMGIARGRYGWVIVANYNPPGNFIGQYARNVPPPKF